MSHIRAGTLRSRVDLYDLASPEQDEFGQVGSSKPRRLGTFRAEVLPQRGRRTTTDAMDHPTVYYRVNMRWLGATRPILPGMYLILQNGAKLDIIAALDAGDMHREWQLDCQQRVSI